MPSGQQVQPNRIYSNPHDSAANIIQSVREQEAQFEQLTRELEAERISVANQLGKYKLRDQERDDVENQPVGYPADDGEYRWRHLNNTNQDYKPKMADSHVLISRTTESTVEQHLLRTVKVQKIQRNYYPDRASNMQHYIPVMARGRLPPEGWLPEGVRLQSTMCHHRAERWGQLHPKISPHPYAGGPYTHEELPEVQESYSTTYQTSTSTNGHHRDDNVSPNSQMSPPVENAQLLSRTTSQTKTQQVKTVTKVITTREVQHIGPDGQPVEYSPFNTPSNAADYGSYPYSTTDVPSNYGTYDSGRPPSPAGQAPSSQSYHPDYGNYGRVPSPNSGRNYDAYARTGQNYPEYGYQDYPPTPPSESPPPSHCAMPQAPRGSVTEYNHRPSSYEELDSSVAPQCNDYQDRYQTAPSPAPGSDRFGTYGYTEPRIPATSPGYNPYETGPPPPQGYLDRRPSYDDHPQTDTSSACPPAPYAPRGSYGENGIPPVDGQHPAPPPHHPHIDYVTTDGEGREVMWRYPDLHEVIEFLNHPNNVVRANAAAYLQHLCYMDDSTKQKTRALGGIPPLIDLLNQDIPEIQKNACGALRNLSYGRQNDENKRTIRNAGGIPALVHLLRKTPDSEIRDLVTGVLWNLSSSEDLKRPIIDDCLQVLVDHVIIPHSGWEKNRDSSHLKSQEIHWSTVFRNASGVIRNVSSAGEYARRKLRECEGLVDALLHLVGSAIGKNDVDNKCVENCVCILRNLSYRCQEVEDPDYEKHHLSLAPSRTSIPIKAVGDNLGCFGANKKKKEMLNAEKRKNGSRTVMAPTARPENPKGMELLWQPDVVQIYLALLSDCSNQETLEAAAGAIQNLAACYWQPSVDIRATVRKEKGLPVLIELVRMDVDRVVCAVATAFRNLAMDQRNKELIGKHAMRDLVQKLPSSTSQQNSVASDDTIAAVLATLNEVIVKNSDFAYSLLEAGGVERLMYISAQKGRFSSRVVKFTSQLLFNMWQHQELREAYKKAGWRECHFITKTMVARNALSPTNSINCTLSRPISTQGGTRYEDKTIPRGRDLNSVPPGALQYSRADDVPLNDLGHLQDQPVMPQQHRPPIGGIPIFPNGNPRSPTEPVYAQVNRDKKKSRQPELSPHALMLDQQGTATAGDSWV